MQKRPIQLIKLTRKSYLFINMDIQCFKLHKKLEKNLNYLKRKREKTIIRMHKISINFSVFITFNSTFASSE